VGKFELRETCFFSSVLYFCDFREHISNISVIFLFLSEFIEANAWFITRRCNVRNTYLSSEKVCFRDYVLNACHELPCVSRAFLNGRNLFSRFSSAPLCSNCSYTDKHLMVESKSMNECFMFCTSSLYSSMDLPISCSVIFIFPMNCIRLSSLLIRLLTSSICILIFS